VGAAYGKHHDGSRKTPIWQGNLPRDIRVTRHTTSRYHIAHKRHWQLVCTTFYVPPLSVSSPSMRLSLLSSASTLLFVSSVFAEGSSDVFDLTPTNFKSIVDPEPLILVEFFAPW